MMRCKRLAALLSLCTGAVFAQTAGVDLDAVAKKAIAQQGVVGASVLVARGGRVLLHKGYGFADLALEAPAKDETVYDVVGPMMPFTGIAIMQQVERGRLALDDDIAKFIPEFPEQGHHVTVRNLLNHTSGIVDYHYLGDRIEATSREPKALDEVMALYADKKWVNEPGTKWDWSISGFQLLVTILERVTGESYEDYVRQNILAPAGVKTTTYCDDFTLTRGLSLGYRKLAGGYVVAHENGMAYNTDLRYCSTVGDLYQMWRAVTEKRLVRPETLAKMSKAEGAAERMSAQDAEMHYGLALTLNHEEKHRSRGQHGSLLGYSGCLYEFPDDQLTVVVLTNTEGQNAYAIGRALARAELGLPELPSPPPARAETTLADGAVTAAEIKSLAGTYVLSASQVPAAFHDSFAQYRRTYRVFDENGRFMIQPLGLGAERLLKQPDGSFSMRSSPRTRVSFVMRDGRAASIKMDAPNGLPLAGDRVGDGDARTFHRQLSY